MTEADPVLRELADLADATGHVAAPPALATALTSLTALARTFFAAAACSIAVLDDDEHLVYAAAAGTGADAIVGVRLPTDRGIAGWVAQSGQPIAVSDLGRDARFARDVAESTSYVPQTLLVVPIETDDRLLGVLSVLDRDEARPAAAADLESASVFAAQAAAIVEAQRAFADAGRVLLQALARSARDGSSLAAALAAVPVTATPALADIAGLLAEVYRGGAAERRLAVTVLREVLAYTDRIGARPGEPPSPAR